ncbi:hypothetical protein DXG03_005889 [Asterophora parasitica]|uniref:Uncharacterized protein n=1 Tax=Asterophora parasitica TaxID=117018 RepID=A0A9P7G1I3_9AGAR|nr:hypothetical protein DXG03_005889 [Asterophora parasitica]
MTSFVLGSGISFEEEVREGGVVASAAAWREVDSRDTRIEPTLPGRPGRVKDTSGCENEKTTGTRTANNDSKESEALITSSKSIKYDTSHTADRHGTEQGNPALCEERPYMFVAKGEYEACGGEDNNDNRKDKGDGRVKNTDEDGRCCANKT